MEIIDFHTHILPPGVIAEREALARRERWFHSLYEDPRARMATAGDLVASMDQAGVDLSVAFGFAFADPGLCQVCNDYTLEAARQYRERLVPYAVLNPCAGRAALLEARRCLEAGAVGIGELLPDGQGFGLTEYAVLDPLMDLARHFEAPVVLHVNEQVGHVYRGKGTQGPREAYLLARHYPENVFVLAHWGGGLPFYELMPEVRRQLGRVYYDTAASIYLYDDAVFTQVMSWAPDKVLFGSDYPLVGQGRCLGRVRDAGLAPAALEALLATNARRVLAKSAPLLEEEG